MASTKAPNAAALSPSKLLNIDPDNTCNLQSPEHGNRTPDNQCLNTNNNNSGTGHDSKTDLIEIDSTDISDKPDTKLLLDVQTDVTDQKNMSVDETSSGVIDDETKENNSPGSATASDPKDRPEEENPEDKASPVSLRKRVKPSQPFQLPTTTAPVTAPEDEESDPEGEDEYIVERIVKKRFVNGKVEYFIKWKNWPSSTNTWEPEEHLSCPEKVTEFEAKLEASKSHRKKKEPPISETRYGFDRGLEAEQILAATDKGGDLKFVIKWKGRSEPDVVLAREANLKCPQVVIKFYEDRLQWTPEDDDDDDDDSCI